MSHSDTKPRIFTADRLSAALHEVGGPARPDYLPDIVAQAGRTRQRPALTFLERWLPMDIAVRRQGVPRAVLVFTTVALLLAVLVATIAFVGSRRAETPLTGATNGVIAFSTGAAIDVVEPDGTGRRTLVPGPGEFGSIAFSPDGERFAYWHRGSASERWELTVVDADGRDPVTVASEITEVIGLYPAWSPDGSAIAFAAHNSASSFRIFVARVDGSGVQQIGDPELDAWGPSWSPDGSTIAFGGGNPNSPEGVRLFLMDRDGTNVRQVSNVRGNGFAFIQTDWSHDGRKITAQASAADNIEEWDIWVINVDGSGATNVGAGEAGDELFPSWAPDRDALIWSFTGTVLLEPGEEQVIFPAVGDAVWSPDGELVVVTSDTGFQVMDLEGTVQIRLDGPASRASWQPLFD